MGTHPDISPARLGLAAIWQQRQGRALIIFVTCGQWAGWGGNLAVGLELSESCKCLPYGA